MRLPTPALQPARHCCCSRPACGMASRPVCSAASNDSASLAVRVTAPGNFDAMCTTLAGCDSSCFRGYVGTWTAYNMQHGSSDTGGQSATPPPPPLPPPAAGAAAVGARGVTPVFVDETVNFRLFRLEDPTVPRIHQVNMYQGGGWPASASYASYLTSDTSPEGRPDGYGLREWRHDPSGALWSPDGSAWRAEPTTAERTLVGLAVPDCGIALVNGALPSSFDPQHTPGSWWMEAIFKTPGSHARRWGQLLRFDAGLLANIKAMGEDLTEFGVDELASCHIDPGSISWQPRRQGSFGDVEALFVPAGPVDRQEGGGPATRLSPHGTSTTFTYDEQQQLTMQTGRCSCHTSSSSSSSSGVGGVGEAAGSPNPGAVGVSGCQQDAVVHVTLPDWSYCRVPADMRQLAGSGSSSSREVVFELGAVLASGALARWVLRYDARGRRLLQSATYELYPAAS